VKWTYSLPTAAGACLGAAIGLDVVSTESPYGLAAGVGLYVMAAFLGGAWVVMLASEHEKHGRLDKRLPNDEDEGTNPGRMDP